MDITANPESSHSLPGDFNLLGTAEVEAFLGGNGFDVKR